MNSYMLMYFSFSIVFSVAVILLLLRIAKAVQNVLDMMDIYLQYVPGAERLRSPED